METRNLPLIKFLRKFKNLMMRQQSIFRGFHENDGFFMQSCPIYTVTSDQISRIAKMPHGYQLVIYLHYIQCYLYEII